ncbi:MAG: response regulator, partial [Chitinivibrionales bacterium]|nr:response regulator [Chitinivibrionales bacterium]MBD3356543.1 response regulator [Chitinivibrionales bacterium]
MTKVYIVDDHDDLRFALKYRLKRKCRTTTIAGESPTAEKALSEIPNLNPEIVLTDITLPDMNGIELVRRLRNQCPDTFIMVVTGHEIERYRAEAMNAGA